MAFYSGMIKSVEGFFEGAEHELLTDLAPFAARLRTEFSDALGNLAQEEYALVKKEIHDAISDIPKTIPAMKPVDLIGQVFGAVVARLPNMGIQVADLALHMLVTAIVASLSL